MLPNPGTMTRAIIIGWILTVPSIANAEITGDAAVLTANAWIVKEGLSNGPNERGNLHEEFYGSCFAGMDESERIREVYEKLKDKRYFTVLYPKSPGELVAGWSLCVFVDRISGNVLGVTLF